MLGFFEDHVIDQLYAYEMLQKFAFGLIGVFIPVHIASQGYPVTWVFIFLVTVTSAFALSSLPASYLIARIGFKHSLIFSYLFYLPGFLVFRLLSLSPGVIISAGVLLGVGKSLHWIPLHAEFAVDSHEDSRGKASSRLLGLPRISRALAPFLGGVIMAALGFQALLAVTILFFVFSAVPLLASKDHRDPLEYGLRSFLDWKYVKLGALFFLRGMTIITGVYLFPLYVFYVVGGTVNVGGASSLANLGAMVFAFFIGRVTDRLERIHLIRIGVISSAMMFWLRSYVSAPLEAFLVSFLAGLLFMTYYIPLYSRLADLAEKEDILEFYAFREVTLGLGKLTALGIGFFFVLRGPVAAAFRTVFFATGIATLGILYFANFVDSAEE